MSCRQTKHVIGRIGMNMDPRLLLVAADDETRASLGKLLPKLTKIELAVATRGDQALCAVTKILID